MLDHGGHDCADFLMLRVKAFSLIILGVLHMVLCCCCHVDTYMYANAVFMAVCTHAYTCTYMYCKCTQERVKEKVEANRDVNLQLVENVCHSTVSS